MPSILSHYRKVSLSKAHSFSCYMYINGKVKKADQTPMGGGGGGGGGEGGGVYYTREQGHRE